MNGTQSSRRLAGVFSQAMIGVVISVPTDVSENVPANNFMAVQDLVLRAPVCSEKLADFVCA